MLSENGDDYERDGTLIRVTTECVTCIHFEVCGLKSCIDEAAAKVDTSKDRWR